MKLFVIFFLSPLVLFGQQKDSTRTNNTDSSIEKTQKLAQIKSSSGKSVSGYMLVSPYYNKPNQKQLIQHFNNQTI